MKQTLYAGIVCGLLITVTAAQAQGVNYQSGGSTGAKGNVEVEWKVEAGEKAQDQDQTQDRVQDPSTHDGDEPLNTQTQDQDRDQVRDPSLREGTTTPGSGAGATTAGIGQEIRLLIQAREVRGLSDEEKQQVMATVRTHAEVQSEQDLANFAKGVLLENAQVEEIAFNYEKIEMNHTMPAKFLGILNGSLSARAEVTADGKVSVTYPWYSFLFKKSVTAADLQASLDAEIEAGNDAWLRGDYSTYAEVIATISDILRAKATGLVTD